MEFTELKIRDFFKVGRLVFSTVAYSMSSSETVEALLRYTEDSCGERESRLDGKKYKKHSFHESFKYLKENHPEYLRCKSGSLRQLIPKKDIQRVYRPQKSINNGLEKEVQEFFVENGVPREKIGVTGSRLIGVENEDSDIDLVVYGQGNFDKARNVLDKLIKKDILCQFKEDRWREAYRKRNPELDYREFVLHEKRKRNRAVYRDTSLDLLYVRDDPELPPNKFEGQKKTKKQIKTVVVDDKFNFDSPATYRVRHPEIEIVVSYTHTYAGQAFKGEEIQAKGVHQSGEFETLVVGTTRTADDEYIKSLSLLNKK
ncbi:nucleotidyltransferase domain-containing protein [Methanonatronarchaeum sp. AMET6-2]|uniref:nucleotidyltransferase domain-containing protein n=1 Tax=Methanonatronarchaeum sp. AMET6-2 TaxID=2933293 RepID=UPI001FF5F63C|nr:nucleotidyltransferase domain-containing protein [Methanonatronarchaeum sp. AMET6-2]UOY10170.1 nucleotidyltransferase domain-containing protein [Methanonatronarchaeum sp. AMET6-2]